MILILVLRYRWCTLLAARQGSGSGMYLHRAWQDVCSEPRLLRMQNGNFMTCALSDLLQVCRPPWLQGCNGSGWDPLLVPAAAYRSFQTGVPCYETTLSMMSESWPVICFLTFWQTDLHCGSSLFVQLPIVRFLLLRPNLWVHRQGGESVPQGRRSRVVTSCRYKPPHSNFRATVPTLLPVNKRNQDRFSDPEGLWDGRNSLHLSV